MKITEMDEGRSLRIKRYVLSCMLHVAFVEIRAAESFRVAKRFSDIFHDLPIRLLRCSVSEDYDKGFVEI